ncbi:MAG: D-alanine--D-alanine ligase family protein [Dermatophilaceae bacterium]
MRVLHLVGSPTSEFFADLSRLYACDALAALSGSAPTDPDAAAPPDEHVVAHVSPGGGWCFPADLTPAALASADSMTTADAVARIVSLSPDIAVPQLFCPAGMTTYRALLDLLGIPFVGNRAETMALGMHKARARAVVAVAGVRVPDGEVLRRGERPSLAPPVVVKPVDADNSAGVALVRQPVELGPALEAAFACSAEVLVERYVELGREVRCGILERAGELVVLPVEEYAVDPLTKPIRGAGDKLARDDAGDLRLVAKDAEHAWVVDPADPVTDAVAAAARACHVALGCRHYSLFDFRIDPAGEVYFLEAGLYCSFAPSSVIAVMAAAAGIPVPDLFRQCVDSARGREAGGVGSTDSSNDPQQRRAAAGRLR